MQHRTTATKVHSYVACLLQLAETSYSSCVSLAHLSPMGNGSVTASRAESRRLSPTSTTMNLSVTSSALPSNIGFGAASRSRETSFIAATGLGSTLVLHQLFPQTAT